MRDAPPARVRPAPLAPALLSTLTKARTAFFADEDLAAAIRCLEPVAVPGAHPRLLRFMARLRLAAGDEAEAARLVTKLVDHVPQPYAWELMAANARAANTLVDRGRRLVHIPVPKCGSTTLRNMILELNDEPPVGEAVHDRADLLRPISWQSLAHDYRTAVRPVILRAPMARLASYHAGNIIERDQLARDTGGKSSFHGLPTRPDWAYFLAHFEAYRRLFIIVRHHVAPASSYIGTDLSRFSDVIRFADLGPAVANLRARLGLAPSGRRDMERRLPSSGPGVGPGADLPAPLAQFYAADYEAFAGYFAAQI